MNHTYFMPKTKLTLSVDKDVVQKVKELGINISQLTEKTLSGIAVSEGEVSEDQLKKGYEGVFEVLRPILARQEQALDRHETWVEVGAVDEYTRDTHSRIEVSRLYLSSAGVHAPELMGGDEILPRIGEPGGPRLEDLHPPMKIVSNFLDVLMKAREKKRERVKDLRLAKAIIQRLAEESEQP